ncbi:ACE1 transcriptional factor [Mycena chlorophos]|uniref:ACE1 transcriptional factor n=1 Tax=Mycena chlorophos TaxID=658473 RepID=A0A8H6WFZ2_MYCCL|nr:ACE1 transcriptional factor [Mycena chlorophos]
MVLISDKKYACETCIKGHRSSACKHTDRPLFEIKKKGRPVTQCEHCRELRKTKQVHVKCICEVKEPPSPVSLLPGKPKKKGTPVIPAEAAFPHGVPSELASDSEQGGSRPSCSCKAGTGDCHCCTPRTRPNQRASPSLPPIPSPTQSAPSPTLEPKEPRNSHHILARIAELRPVLPPQHDLFHGSTHHHVDHFSPYGRAYAHEGGFYQQDARSLESLHSVTSLSSHLSSRSQGKSSKAGQKSPIENSSKGHTQRSASFDGHSGTSAGFFGGAVAPETDWRLAPSLSRVTPVEAAPYPRSEPSFPLDDVSRSEAAYPRSEPGAPAEDRFPMDLATMRMCGCGDGCACPGCSVHNPLGSNPSSTSASPTPGQKRCADTSCGDACLDCTMLDLTGFGGFTSPAVASPTKQEDTITSPFEMFPSDTAGAPTPAPEAQFQLENYDLEGVPERLDLDLELEDYGVPYGPVNAFEQIDEWIQALPPPPPSGELPSPFEFAETELTFDGSGAPSWGAVQMFDLDAEQADAPNVLPARSTTSTSSSSLDHRPTTGLSGGSPDPSMLYSHSRGSSGAFLTVPGPDAHRRSRSSSSASSDVSSGIFAQHAYGSLEQTPVPGSTLKQQQQQHLSTEMSMMVMHPTLMQTFIAPPPPIGSALDEFMDDEQMSFF